MTVKGLTIKPKTFNSGDWHYSGVWQNSRTIGAITIENCTFDFTATPDNVQNVGIKMSRSDKGDSIGSISISGCEFICNAKTANAVTMGDKGAVGSINVSNNKVTGNCTSSAIHMDLGYQTEAPVDINVSGNEIDGVNGRGILIANIKNDEADISITDNAVTGASTGIYFYNTCTNANTLTVENNTITNVTNGIDLTFIASGTPTVNVAENDIVMKEVGNAFVGFEPAADSDNTVTELTVTTDTSKIYVNGSWAALEDNSEVYADGKLLVIGVNAYSDINEAEGIAEESKAELVIAEGADVTYTKDQYYFLNTNPNAGGENNAFDNVVDAAETYDLTVNGTLKAYQILLNNAETVVSTTGKLLAAGEAFRVMGGTIEVNGNRAADAADPAKDEVFSGSWGGGVKAGSETQIQGGYFMINQEAVAKFNDTVIFVAAGVFNIDNADADFSNTYIYCGSVGTYQDIQMQFTNGADVAFTANSTVINDEEFGMHITVDATSTLTLSADSKINASTLTVAEGGKFIIDAADFEGFKKVVDLSGETSLEGKVTIANGDDVSVIYGADGDVTLVNVDTSVLYVDATFAGEYGAEVEAGKFCGINAFASFADALKNVGENTNGIEISGSLAESATTDNITVAMSKDLIISGGSVNWNAGKGWIQFKKADGVEGTVNLTFEDFQLTGGASGNTKVFYFANGTNTTIGDGASIEFYNGAIQPGAIVTVKKGGELLCMKEALQVQASGDLRAQLIVEGEEGFDTAAATLADRMAYTKYANVYADVIVTDSFYSAYDYINVRESGKFVADNSVVEIGADQNGTWNYNPVPNGFGQLKVSGADSVFSLENGSVLKASGNITNAGTINVADSTLIADGKVASNGVIDAYNKGVLTNNGTINVSGESTVVIRELAGNVLDFADGTVLVDSNINYTGSDSMGLNGVTFKGDNVIYSKSYATSSAKFTVAEDGSLKSTGGRWALGGNAEWNINGSIEDVKALSDDEKATLKASLEVAGLSLSTGGGEAVMNVNDAYVKFTAYSSTKNTNQGKGKITMNFTNSLVESSAKIEIGQTKAGYDAAKAPEIVLNVKDSIFTIGNYFTNNHAKGTVSIDNSDFSATAFGNVGTFSAVNGSNVNFKLVNNALNDWAGKGGLNAGSMTVDKSNLTIANSGATLEFYNVGNIVLSNDATFTIDKLVNANANDLTGGGKINEVFADMVGNIEVNGANLNVAQLINNGTFNASGNLTLNIGKLTGVINVGDAVLQDGTSIGDTRTDDDYIVFDGDVVDIEGNVKTAVDIESYSNINVKAGANLTAAWIWMCETEDSFTVDSTATVDCTDLWSSVSAPAYAKIDGTVNASHNVWLHNADIYGSLSVGNQLCIYSNDEFNVYGDLFINGDGSPAGMLVGNPGSSSGAYAGDVTVNVKGGNLTITGKSLGNEILIATNGILNITADDEGNGSTVSVNGIIANNGELTVSDSAISSNYQIVNNATGTMAFYNADVTVTYASAKDGKGSITNNGTMIVDENTFIDLGSFSNKGTIVIDVTDDWSGVKTVIDGRAGVTFGNVVVADKDAGYYVDETNGDLVVYKVDTETIYVNADWADQDYAFCDKVEDGKYFGVNAFADMLSVEATESSKVLEIAGGTYQSEFNTTSGVSVMKGGISTVNASGEVVVDLGSLVFKTDVEGDVYVNGNFTTTDTNTWNYELGMMPYYNGAIQFVGTDNTTFNIDGIFNAAEGFSFNTGKAIVSADSVLTVNDQNCGQINVYGEVISYGEMSVDLQKGSTLRLVNIEKGGSLTLSGENATLNTNIINDKPWAGAQCVDFYLDNGTLNVEDGAAVNSTGIIDIKSTGVINVSNAAFEAGTILNAGSLNVAGGTFAADEVSGSGSFTIGTAVDAEGNVIATELNIGALKQDVYANQDSDQAIVLTGSVGLSKAIRVYGEATLADFDVNASYTGALVSASGRVNVYGDTRIADGTVMNLNAFQTTNSGVIEKGAVINTANFNAYDSDSEEDAVFTVEGELNTVSFIVTNDYYTKGNDELVIAKDGVVTATYMSGNGRFSLQTGAVTVYGYLYGDLSSGGGKSNIGSGKGYAMNLTIDGTYASEDSNNGKLEKVGSQIVNIYEESVVNVINGGSFSWTGGQVNNYATISVDGAASFFATTLVNEGMITVNNATLTGDSIVNNGTITVTGESTLSASFSGTAVSVAASAVLNVVNYTFAAGEALINANVYINQIKSVNGLEIVKYAGSTGNIYYYIDKEDSNIIYELTQAGQNVVVDYLGALDDQIDVTITDDGAYTYTIVAEYNGAAEYTLTINGETFTNATGIFTWTGDYAAAYESSFSYNVTVKDIFGREYTTAGTQEVVDVTAPTVSEIVVDTAVDAGVSKTTLNFTVSDNDEGVKVYLNGEYVGGKGKYSLEVGEGIYTVEVKDSNGANNFVYSGLIENPVDTNANGDITISNDSATSEQNKVVIDNEIVTGTDNKDGEIIVDSYTGVEVNGDIKSSNSQSNTIVVGTSAELDVSNNNISDVTDFESGAGAVVKANNYSATDDADSFYLGMNGTAEFAAVDMQTGADEIYIGYAAKFEAASVAGTETIKVSRNGIFAATGAVGNVNSLTVGTDAVFSAGTLTGTAGDDILTFNGNRYAVVGAVDLKGGADTLALKNGANVIFTGSFEAADLTITGNKTCTIFVTGEADFSDAAGAKRVNIVEADMSGDGEIAAGVFELFTLDVDSELNFSTIESGVKVEAYDLNAHCWVSDFDEFSFSGADYSLVKLSSLDGELKNYTLA